MKQGDHRASPLDYIPIIPQPRRTRKPAGAVCLHATALPFRGGQSILAYFAAAKAAALVPAMRPQTNALVMVKPM